MKSDLSPKTILKEVKSHLGERGILVSDVGKHKMIIAKHYEATVPNTVLISNGFCSMAGALSGAIGVWLAETGQTVMAIVGDGGFQMCSSEMETAKRLGANITVQIWVDGGYGLIKYKQRLQFGEHTELDFNNPDFKLIAEAYGWFYSDDLKEALEHDGPSLMVQYVKYN